MNHSTHTTVPARTMARCWKRLLLAMLLVGPALAMAAGCAVEDKNPRTVTEFLKMKRVGEVD